MPLAIEKLLECDAYIEPQELEGIGVLDKKGIEKSVQYWLRTRMQNFGKCSSDKVNECQLDKYCWFCQEEYHSPLTLFF